MTAPKAPQRPVPTLTEVIDLARARPLRPAAPGGAEPVAAAGLPVPEVWESGSAQARPQPGGAEPSVDELSERVLHSLQAQIDALFEGRMQQALAPALARAADGLIREMRGELDAALRDLVQQAVAHELARRGRR